MQDLSAREVYALLTSIVSPRPIAWVSTQNESGHRNLAPFSYYQALCSRPPMIMISVGWHRDGRPKHTLANILEQREFVVNHVQLAQGSVMAQTAAETEQSEWTQFNVEPTPANKVAPPRVAGSVAALECVLTHAIPLGQGPAGTPSSTVIFGEVVHMYVNPALVQTDEKGRHAALDAAALQSLGRLSGGHYCRSDPPFELPPKIG